MKMMLFTLQLTIPYSLKREQNLNSSFYSYGILFYKQNNLSDHAVELIDKINSKTQPIFEIMVVDCELPENSDTCARAGTDEYPFLQFFNIQKDPKTVVYEGDYEEQDLWIEVRDILTDPWRKSYNASAILFYLENDQKNALFLFTPGPEVPLMFVKLGMNYYNHFFLVWQPNFEDVGVLENFSLGKGLKPNHLNLVVNFNNEFIRYEGKWSKSAVKEFLDEEIIQHLAEAYKQEL